MPHTIHARARTGLATAIAWGALGLGLGAATAADEPPPRLALPTRHPIAAPAGRSASERPESSAGAWFGTAGIAVALAAFGAIAYGARKLKPSDAGPLKVVGRASLSPRLTVYLLQAGDRVLILGAGGQGPPALLGEMPAASPASGGAS